jgi:hypothetical protein
MTNEELAKLIMWLENMITNSKISIDENRDDDETYPYFQGRASAFQEVLTDIQMGTK